MPQYYVTSSQRPPSVAPPHYTSSLAPTSPVYTAQRIRSSNSYGGGEAGGGEGADFDYPYSAEASNIDNNGKFNPGTTSPDYDDAPENSGFVQPIDFKGLLKDIGNAPPAIAPITESVNTAAPLFASESKDTFNGFFGASKNPFEELSRLNTASSDHVRVNLTTYIS